MAATGRARATAAFWEQAEVVAEFRSLPPPAYWAEELARLRAGTVVLDIGCGGGRNTVTAARLSHVVHACDLSAGMLHAARRAVKTAGGAATFVRASMSRLPYATGTFGGAIASGVLHNACSVADLRTALTEFARVLRPDGRLLLNVFTGDIEPANWHRQPGEPVHLDPDGTAMTLLPADDMLAELTAAGFAPVGEPALRESTVSSGRRSVRVGVFRGGTVPGVRPCRPATATT